MFNLLIILLSTINSEPIDSNNYKIARYIMENIDTMEKCTISELAKQCYVSNSSVSRFCRDIGLEDFTALKQQITIYAIQHKSAPNKFKFQGFDDQSLCRSYLLSVIDNLNHMYSKDVENQIKKVAKDISKYNKIAAFGYMQSESVALNLQFDLQRTDKVIFTCIKIVEQIDYINNADKDTLIIIFSESGAYFRRLFDRKKPFKNTQNKPKIYLITSNQDVSIPYVDEYIRYNCRHDYASHPYPLLMIEAMISISYTQLLYSQKNTIGDNFL